MTFISTTKQPSNPLIHYSQLNDYNPHVQTATSDIRIEEQAKLISSLYKNQLYDTAPTDNPIQNITKSISIRTPGTPYRFSENNRISSPFPRDLPIDVQPIPYKSSSSVTTTSSPFDLTLFPDLPPPIDLGPIGNLMQVDSSETYFEEPPPAICHHPIDFHTPFSKVYKHLRGRETDIFHQLYPVYKEESLASLLLEPMKSEISTFPLNNQSPSFEDIFHSLPSFNPDKLMNFSEYASASSSSSISTYPSPMWRRKLPAKHRHQVASSPIQKIPGVILDKIFNYISSVDLYFAHCVCQFWKKNVPYINLVPDSNITDKEFIDIIKTNPKSIAGINLDNCKKITNAVISDIAKLQNLRLLYLPGEIDIPEARLAELAKLQNLYKLDLYNCNVTSEGLSKLHNLKVLVLSNFNFTNMELAEIAKLHKLTELDLSSCNITNEELVKIAKLHNLRKLNLSNCNQITDEGLAEIAKLHNLRNLDLSNCYLITDEGLPEIAKLHNLEFLNLSYCGITDTGVPELVKLQNLLELDLSGTLITNAPSLAKLQSLERLDLLDCPITYQGVTELAKLKIDNLNLSFCDQITDKELVELAKSQSLKEIYLNKINLITDDGLAELTKLNSLNKLHLKNCSKITKAGIIQFHKLRISNYEKSDKCLNIRKQLNACVLFPGINADPLFNIIASYLSVRPIKMFR